jgi:hypothetical protein
MPNDRPGREADQSGKFRPVLNISNKAGTPGAEVECQLIDYRVIDKGKEHYEIATVKLVWSKDLPTQAEGVTVKEGEEYDLFVGSQLLYKFRANKICTKDGKPDDMRALNPGFYIVYKGKAEITDGEWEGTLAHQWEVGFLKAK